jgi:hypothetical protein
MRELNRIAVNIFFPIQGSLSSAPAPVLLPSSISTDDVEEELQGLLSEMLKLKLGLKKTCVAFARALADEGVMSLERLRPMEAQDARGILQSAGLKKLQIESVLQALGPASAAPAADHEELRLRIESLDAKLKEQVCVCF